MRDIKIEKVVLNIGCGTKTNIENAKKVLEQVSSRKVVITKTKKRSTFNVPKGKPIGCKVTIRKGCDEFLSKLFKVKENIPSASFDSQGNFSFGIKEYIEIPGMEYDPKIGILGFDVCVTLERPGYRVRRKKLSSRLGRKHVITKQDSMDFVKNKFKINIV